MVNGETRQVPEGLNVSKLLQHLGLDPALVAIEMNRAIVRKTEWERTELKPGVQLEIVQFVGGG